MEKRQTIDPGGWQAPFHTFAPAVRKGNMLFISGTDASLLDTATGKPYISGDFADQYRVIMEKFKIILATAGASFDDIVYTCDYITTKEGYKATSDVRREYFGTSFPTSTGVVVKDLLSRNALVEVDAIAVLG